jgi:hypothetical protein
MKLFKIPKAERYLKELAAIEFNTAARALIEQLKGGRKASYLFYKDNYPDALLNEIKCLFREKFGKSGYHIMFDDAKTFLKVEIFF